MNPKKLLILVGIDPRTSARAAEAIRIAAGIGAWRKVVPSVYFHGDGVRCLTEEFDDLQGGQLLEQYLPAILSHGGAFYVPAAEPLRWPSKFPTIILGECALREMVASVGALMNFGVKL